MASCKQNHPKRPVLGASSCWFLGPARVYQGPGQRLQKACIPVILAALVQQWSDVAPEALQVQTVEQPDLRENLVTPNPARVQWKGWRCRLLPPPAIRGTEARQSSHALRPRITRDSGFRACQAQDLRCKHKHPAACPHLMGILKGSCPMLAPNWFRSSLLPALTVPRLACLGYIVPEYYRWPGDLSPSLGLKRPGVSDFLFPSCVVYDGFAFCIDDVAGFVSSEVHRCPHGLRSLQQGLGSVGIAEQSRCLQRPERRCRCPAGHRWLPSLVPSSSFSRLESSHT